MSSRSGAVCPALKRQGDTYICEYTGRPVNPYAWSCLLDYYTCPIYIRHRAAAAKAVEKAEQKPAEATAETTVTAPAPAAPSVEAKPAETVMPKEYEELIIDDLRRIISEYENKVQDLNDKWSTYERSVNDTRLSFSRDRILIEHHLELLKRAIIMYETDLKELDYRRSVGLLDEEQYIKLRDEIENRLSKLKREYEELSRRYSEVTSGISTHVKRLLAITPTLEVSKMRLVLARLDELLREGKISQEIYEKLKREIESLVGGE